MVLDKLKYDLIGRCHSADGAPVEFVTHDAKRIANFVSKTGQKYYLLKQDVQDENGQAMSVYAIQYEPDLHEQASLVVFDVPNDNDILGRHGFFSELFNTEEVVEANLSYKWISRELIQQIFELIEKDIIEAVDYEMEFKFAVARCSIRLLGSISVEHELDPALELFYMLGTMYNTIEVWEEYSALKQLAFAHLSE